MVTQGATTTEFTYSNYQDWNNPLHKIEVFYAGRLTERKNGAVARDLTTSEQPGSSDRRSPLEHLRLYAIGCFSPTFAASSYPYATFFTTFDAEGASWLTQDEIIDTLAEAGRPAGTAIERASVETYFAGIDKSLRPGGPLYSLGLVERRQDADGPDGQSRRGQLRP